MYRFDITFYLEPFIPAVLDDESGSESEYDEDGEPSSDDEDVRELVLQSDEDVPKECVTVYLKLTPVQVNKLSDFLGYYERNGLCKFECTRVKQHPPHVDEKSRLYRLLTTHMLGFAL